MLYSCAHFCWAIGEVGTQQALLLRFERAMKMGWLTFYLVEQVQVLVEKHVAVGEVPKVQAEVRLKGLVKPASLNWVLEPAAVFLRLDLGLAIFSKLQRHYLGNVPFSSFPFGVLSSSRLTLSRDVAERFREVSREDLGWSDSSSS
jgi:hypothetical protein